ncbi:MAG: hypothetical protein ABI389_02290 [Rhodanobacter sp.]
MIWRKLRIDCFGLRWCLIAVFAFAFMGPQVEAIAARHFDSSLFNSHADQIVCEHAKGSCDGSLFKFHGAQIACEIEQTKQISPQVDKAYSNLLKASTLVCEDNRDAIRYVQATH